MVIVNSPCIGSCQCNTKNICMGCGRTRYEISKWGYLSNNEKKEIVKVSKQRLSQENW